MAVWRESDYLDYCAVIRDTYREAGREPDDYYPVWPGRATFDYARGALSWPTSCAKHLRECRDALGLAPIVPPVPPVGDLALNLRGRFLYNGDRVFRWQGITAFALGAMITEGRQEEARAWLLAQRTRGFTAARVLTMCSWLNLGPEKGLQALEVLLPMAAEIGTALELVALADTVAFGFSEADCHAHARAVAEKILAHNALGRVLVQGANEHYHPTQIGWLHEVDNVDRLVAGLPEPVWVTASPAADDEALEPTGEYVTRHLDRSRDLWNMVRRVRELENVSAGTDRYVINDEPIGAGEVEQPGRRCTDPAIFFTFGVLGRIFEVGTTFHCEAGLRCDPLGPVQQACAEAFIHGATAIPAETVLTFKNAMWADSPVRTFDTAKAVRVYSGVSGDVGWTCALGLTGDPRIEWQHHWAPSGPSITYPGVTLTPIRKGN